MILHLENVFEHIFNEFSCFIKIIILVSYQQTTKSPIFPRKQQTLLIEKTQIT